MKVLFEALWKENAAALGVSRDGWSILYFCIWKTLIMWLWHS